MIIILGKRDKPSFYHDHDTLKTDKPSHCHNHANTNRQDRQVFAMNVKFNKTDMPLHFHEVPRQDGDPFTLP